MKIIKKGYDFYECSIDFYAFLSLARQHDWKIIDIHKNEQFTFYASITNRNEIERTIPGIKRYHRNGISGMITRFLRVERVVLILSMLLTFYVLNQIIFEVEVLGESNTHDQLIHNKLEEYRLKTPFWLSDKKKLKQSLLLDLRNELNWLELSINGSKLSIRYLPKEHYQKEVLHDNNLYAMKDGVIAYFDVDFGVKHVSINDVVSKGDLLISNTLIDSYNQPQHTYVLGEVYAYTFIELSASVDKSMPRPYAYFECLTLIREQVADMIEDKEKIIKEIPLQFIQKEDKIIMKNYYVLLEQIAGLGEINGE